MPSEEDGAMWWLIIRTPGGTWAWPVWAEDAPADENLVNAARVLTDFPANDDWVKDARYDLQLTQGDPHQDLLARATVGGLKDLLAVDPAAVQAHADARAQAAHEAMVAATVAHLANLPASVLQAVMTHPDVAGLDPKGAWQ